MRQFRGRADAELPVAVIGQCMGWFAAYKRDDGPALRMLTANDCTILRKLTEIQTAVFFGKKEPSHRSIATTRICAERNG